ENTWPSTILFEIYPFFSYNISEKGVSFMYREAEEKLTSWYTGSRRKPLVIRGARQVGKSTLVRSFCDAQGIALYEVNLEKHRVLDSVFASFDSAMIIRELQVVVGRRITAEGGLLFLDEIQATPHAIAALRYFYEERPDLAVIVAGSLMEFVLADHSFSMPVGRVEYFRMGPVTFREYLNAIDPDLRRYVAEYRIGASLPESAHRKLVEYQRQFLLVGGMPEVVQAAIDGASFQEMQSLQQSLVDTFRDDFAKYAAQSQLVRLQVLFDAIPQWIGRKVIYRKMVPEGSSAVVRTHLELLIRAGLCTPVHHTAGSGIPLAALIDRNVYKLLHLDVGMLTMMSGLSWKDIARPDARALVNEGTLAEQFVGQELLAALENSPDRGLYYWLRDRKSANAEVDFVISHGNTIVPVEVKAGRSGSLKSLHQFVHQKKPPLAVRFDLNLPSEQVVDVRVMPDGVSVPPVEPVAVRYRLISLPLYVAGELPRLVSQLEG
ncbi:MAG: ATP-binding protein, partial [Alkalispirochaeta sp.]